MTDFLVIYLHGFLSSPESMKARQLREFAFDRGIGGSVQVPLLQAGPRADVQAVMALIRAAGDRSVGLIGSSLGGFYATSLAEACQVPAVLINPAVRRHEYWRDYLGTHTNFHSGEPYTVTEQHLQELQALAPASIRSHDKYRVYLQRHDEVLDYRKALEFYGEYQCVIRDDGDHSYSGFARELPEVFEFLLSRIT